MACNDLKLKIDGVDRTALLIHETLSISQSNDGLNSTCTFDLLDQAVIRVGIWTVQETHVEDGDVITGYTTFFPQTKVEVYITNAAETLIYFGGTLARVTATHMGQLEVMTGFTEPESQVLRCECQDFNQILEEMVIDDFREYGGIQDEALIDAVFDEFVFPFGNPIDYATFVTAVPYVFDIITFDSITVRQFMDTICAQTEAVWYVDYSKKLHYAANEAALIPAWHLSDNPDDINSFEYFDDIIKEKDATNLVNMVFVVCGTDLLPVSLWFSDAGSIALYGEHRAIVRDTSLFDIDDIEAKGNAILEKFKHPIITYTLKTYKGTPGGGATTVIRAGQHVRVVCAFHDLDETFLINGLIITFPVDGTPVYEITCGGLDTSAAGAAARYNLDQIHVPNITPSSLPIAARGWGHDMTFSAADDDTVAWTAGTITTADGQTFNIAPGANTGDMVAVTYVYLDTSLSIIALQHSVNAVDSIGLGKILIAVCVNDTAAVPTSAMYQVFGGGAGTTVFLHADNVAANCITANEIYGNTLSVVAADMGLLIAGEIRMIGAAGSMTLDPTGIKLFDGNDPAADNILVHLNTADGSIIIKSADAGDRVELDSAGLRLYDGVNLLIDLNTTNATFTLKSALAGNPRIEVTSTEIAGYDGADVVQFEVSAADGKGYFGGGAGILDEDGLHIDTGLGLENYIHFKQAGVDRGYLNVYTDADGCQLNLVTGPPVGVGDRGRINIEAKSEIDANSAKIWLQAHRAGPTAGTIQMAAQGAIDLAINPAYVAAYNDLRVKEGLYVGSVAVDPDDNDVWLENDLRAGGGLVVGSLVIDPVSGRIYTDGADTDGTQGWELGRPGVGTNPATHNVEVIINGVAYHLHAWQA